MEEIGNFIKTIMEEDLKNKKVTEIVTRFPPEPNAYLHIGHARALVMNFELAKLFNGYTNLRFDDTNPAKEDTEYVEGIINDIKWLGYTPKNIFFGSDYFEKTFAYAVYLIKHNLAYVCDLSQEEISKTRGSLTEPGKDSPYRNRSTEENLTLFYEMRDGKYKAGEKVLRAKIDMAHPNLNMRDPVLYRILDIPHHRQGDKWKIYPMYDFAHPLQDAIEGITHSLCSLEYDNHRILYDWVINNCPVEHIPHQYEFGRLNITGTVTSKRFLRLLVENGKVSGWDDPRLPTLCGLRRRGVTPASIRNFILSCGLSRINSNVDPEMLKHFIRDDLKLKTKRIMAVKEPLLLTISNYPEGKIEYLPCLNNQENPALGEKTVAFGKHLYIERDDFMLEAPDRKFKRLALGLEVRLMHAYFVKAVKVNYDEENRIKEVVCTYDPATKSGSGFSARKPNGTISYVAKDASVPVTFRLYSDLLQETKGDDLLSRFNEDSLKIRHGFAEKGEYSIGDRFQIIRDGYYIADKDSSPDNLIFNQIVGLKSGRK